MHQITKKWYGAAEHFNPKPDTDYSWVWEYAQFRFQWACGNSRYIEEKAMTLFKFVLAIFGGYGAVISFLVSHKVHLTIWSCILGLPALLCLTGAGLTLFQIFDPSDHLAPIVEEAALTCIDDHASNQNCRANMSLAMAASTEFEMRASTEKATWLRRGLVLSCFSVVLFILALSALVSQ